GHVAGVAFDVFEKEPPAPDNPLLKLEKAITTPHLGASTEEAQVKVAVDVSEQIVDVLNGKPARSAVNMPALSAELMTAVAPFMTLGERIGSMITQIADGAIKSVEISYCGELSNLEIGPVTRSVLKGLLQPVLQESVNVVNAPLLIESRGIRVTESKSCAPVDYTSLLAVKVDTDKGVKTISGTLFGKKDIRIVSIDDYQVDLVPEGYMLMTMHNDRPGIIGSVGKLLGDQGINIGGMNVARLNVGALAMMLLTVDDPVAEPVLKQIHALAGIEVVKLLQLS
ncbi:MAG TPA: ACT domain-containing protein, partial [Armatimonadota bacterium]